MKHPVTHPLVHDPTRIDLIGFLTRTRQPVGLPEDGMMEGRRALVIYDVAPVI